MKQNGSRPLIKKLGKGFAATLLALCLMMVVSTAAFAASIKISDAASVLDDNQVKNSVSIGYEVDIFTTSTFSGDKAAFVRQAQSHLGNSNVVVAISTNKKWISVNAGSKVPLSSSEAVAAQDAFINSYKSHGNYTQATIQTLQSIRTGIGNRSSSSSHSSSNNSSLGAICLVGFIILAAIAVITFFARRRRGGGPMFGSRPVNYQQPYNSQYPGQYPPGQYPGQYPPNYGPQQGGMNPWVAGGLGAAAGGLVGYELGRHAGEHHHHGDYSGGGGGGNYDSNEYGGSGGVGDFGGGDAGDFGGGDFGGGDFGGGDFGGGGDAGSF